MPETQTAQSPNPELIRSKLKQVAEKYLPQVPDYLNKAAKESANPMLSMGLGAFKPFLPQLSRALLNTIDEAEPERLLELVRFIDGVGSWLKEQPENDS